MQSHLSLAGRCSGCLELCVSPRGRPLWARELPYPPRELCLLSRALPITTLPHLSRGDADLIHAVVPLSGGQGLRLPRAMCFSDNTVLLLVTNRQPTEYVYTFCMWSKDTSNIEIGCCRLQPHKEASPGNERFSELHCRC